MMGRHIAFGSSSAELRPPSSREAQRLRAYRKAELPPVALVQVPQGAYRPLAPPSGIIASLVLGGVPGPIDHPQQLRSRRVSLRRHLRGPLAGRHGGDACRFTGVFGVRDLARYGPDDSPAVFSHREPSPSAAASRSLRPAEGVAQAPRRALLRGDRQGPKIGNPSITLTYIILIRYI